MLSSYDPPVNVLKLSIKRRSEISFRLTYQTEYNKYPIDFYMDKEVIEDILRKKRFCPFYSDCFILLQYTERNLRFINIETKEKELFIPFRNAEFYPQLNIALSLEEDQELDLIPAYLNSLEMAKPNVEVIVTENATEIYKLEGLKACIERVKEIANNRSTGQDDPVKLTFSKDYAPHDLYWTITNNGKFYMNGGIIFHGNGEWGIHT